MMALLRAEMLKLRTTRTVWGLLVATVVLTGAAVAGAVVVADNAGIALESEKGVRLALHVSGAGAIFVLVLGIVMTAGEYRQRTATDTFLTTPDRWRVLVAKLVSAMAVGAGFGAVSAGVALAVGSHVYQLKGYPLPLDASGAWSILLGAVGRALVRDPNGDLSGRAPPASCSPCTLSRSWLPECFSNVAEMPRPLAADVLLATGGDAAAVREHILEATHRVITGGARRGRPARRRGIRGHRTAGEAPMRDGRPRSGDHGRSHGDDVPAGRT